VFLYQMDRYPGGQFPYAAFFWPALAAASAGETASSIAAVSSPRDEFDRGVVYIERKDYELAEQTLRDFLKRYPSDPLTADAKYWLGESLYERAEISPEQNQQQYRDAADLFLGVAKQKSGKAPDALLRLGQSLAALKEREGACAVFGELTSKYPNSSATVKQGAERSKKRFHC
jgi:tol-pal system protein YbgF